MKTAAECLEYALKCEAMARANSDEIDRRCLLATALAWRRLAVFAQPAPILSLRLIYHATRFEDGPASDSVEKVIIDGGEADGVPRTSKRARAPDRVDVVGESDVSRR